MGDVETVIKIIKVWEMETGAAHTHTHTLGQVLREVPLFPFRSLADSPGYRESHQRMSLRSVGQVPREMPGFFRHLAGVLGAFEERFRWG